MAAGVLFRLRLLAALSKNTFDISSRHTVHKGVETETVGDPIGVGSSCGNTSTVVVLVLHPR